MRLKLCYLCIRICTITGRVCRPRGRGGGWPGGGGGAGGASLATGSTVLPKYLLFETLWVTSVPAVWGPGEARLSGMCY